MCREQSCVTGGLQRELRCCVDTAEPDNADTPPPAKKQRSSLFGRYSLATSSSAAVQEKTPARILSSYLDTINAADMKLCDVFSSTQFCSIFKLLERVLCVPASSAPVERVFSQSGLIMRPNRCRMSDSLREELVFLKCNE